MKSKKFLFLPVEVGLAHITRSLAIAERLVEQGNEAYLVIPSTKKWLTEETRVHLIEIDSQNDFKDDLSFLDAFRDPLYLYKASQEDKEIIERIRPDCVVVDYRLSGIVASTVCAVETVFICDGGWGPYDSLFPNPGIPKFVFYILKPFIGQFLKHFKRKFMSAVYEAMEMHGFRVDRKEVLNSILFIVPDSFSYLPTKSQLHIEHTGPIFWRGKNLHKNDEFDKLVPDGKTIYLTFGGTGFDSKKMIAISNLLVKNGYRVLVTSSTVANKQSFQNQKGLFVFDFLDGKKVSKLADLVVCHGGYGTMMDAALAKKPTVAIPYNFSQLIHAFRFQELGMGKCVSKTRMRSYIHVLTNNWKKFEQDAKEIDPQEVLLAVGEVMKEYDAYAERIENFINTMEKGEGDIRAARSISQFMEKV